MTPPNALKEALCYIESGQLEAAEAKCQEILHADPCCADAYHLFGHVRRLRGDLPGALSAMGRAVSLAPDNADYLNNIGSVHLQAGQFDPAERCFKRAIDINPGHALAKLNLQLTSQKKNAIQPSAPCAPSACPEGDKLFGLQDYSGALQEYDRVLALNHPSPGLAGMLFNKAACLFSLNRYEEALVALEPIPEIDSTLTYMVMRRRGDALQILGRLDDACAAYDAGIALQPGNVGLVFSRASIRRISRNEPFFRYVRNFEPVVGTLIGRTKAMVCYALGKSYADIEEFSRAAEYYKLGAAAICDKEPYEAAGDNLLDTQITTLCSPQFLAATRPLALETRKPIFILGMPRSGTTLIEQILSSHPDVYPGGELPYFETALRNLACDPHHLTSTSASLIDCAKTYLDMLAKLPNVQHYAHVTDKRPHNYKFIGLIAAAMPAVKIIHCRRSPIDTALSCYTTLFAEGLLWSFDLRALGRYYRTYHKMMNFWRQLLPAGFYEVRYESMVQDQAYESRALLDACGVEWDERVLRYYESCRPVTTASVIQVRRPIYTSSSGRWKKWKPYIQPLLDEIGDLELAYWEEIGVKAEL